MSIEADREESRPRVDEILAPYRKMINSTPELQSLLYDVDMLPEQTTSIIGAIRLVGLCEVWKLKAAEWQPIETAPKDGTIILVWHRIWKCPISARYLEGRKSQCKWVEATITTEWPDEAFTHWQSLLDAPK